jgi:chromosome segregation protein
VLGSQSAKSLRGKEMTDVIFNGCGSRSPCGTGEVTLTLDNEAGQLPLEAKEVHVTRRVYRSGEGEYLINRQPCRLRDIRDLLAGTGITTEAYCIIEQGRVDALLQASPRDRRIVFEEAAGISQFKAKKATASRRLERVEQNLLRLSDIVDEVESRLRSVRSQAGKARRYRECSERLQHLRTGMGLADWQTLTKQINTRESQLAELRCREAEGATTLEAAEAQLQELERSFESALDQQREFDAAASAIREQIVAGLAAVEHQRTRHAMGSVKSGGFAANWRQHPRAVPVPTNTSMKRLVDCDHRKRSSPRPPPGDTNPPSIWSFHSENWTSRVRWSSKRASNSRSPSVPSRS